MTQQPGPGASQVDEAQDRRADSLEIVELLLALVGAAVYVYVIGWAITWVRLAAARLPVDASLPMIDNKVLFVAGLRLVVVMAIVFAAMCAVAWAVHFWTWEHQAPEWHRVIKLGRPAAAKPSGQASNPNPAAAPAGEGQAEPAAAPAGDGQAEPAAAPRGDGQARSASRLSRIGRVLKPRSRPPDNLVPASVGDGFVRVVAGFNVGVLAATFGLALARLAKTFIDQEWPPGPWWDLLAPWVLASAILALFFAWVGPLWGNRFVHGLLWIIVIVVALVSEAPIGLLLLTWAGVATVGRAYGKVRSKIPGKPGRRTAVAEHPGHLSFVLSPLPWILLTIYALVGLAFYALPPVSFSQAIVTTPTGVRTGGYLARTGMGVYLVSCTPLADATSSNELVSMIPSADVRAMTTGTTPFVVDSGLRSSLPTLALHAFGIEATTPSWIRPEARSSRATCAGDPLPRPSVGYPAPQLGAGVTAGPAPPGGQANDGEKPIEQTSPKIAALARRFQPTVLVTIADPFWPVSVGAVLADLGSNGEPTCLQHLPKMCPPKTPRAAPTMADLGKPGSGPNDFLEYPASPPLDPDPNGQVAAFLSGQQGHPVSVPRLRRFLADPGLLNPWYSAQVYFYYGRNTDPASWPAPDPALKGKPLIALQYWFFYPYNYYPTVVDAALMDQAPVAADLVNTDLHQGDWEHVIVLLDSKTHKPLWLYTARHSNEGEYYAWNSALLTFDDGHPIVQAALGGHPTYDAHCRQSLRFVPMLPGGVNGRVADWIACGSGRFAFRAATTPLVDIAKAPWACWRGHFGVATAKTGAAAMNEGSIQRAIRANYYVAGPRSPLWQAENGGLAADKTPKPGARPPIDTGVCANGHNPAAPENTAIKSGL
jgi:hypothetical protein